MLKSSGYVDQLYYFLGMDDKEFQSSAAKDEQIVANMSGSFAGLTGILTKVAAAFGAFKLVDFLKEATLTAARTEVLGTVLEQVGKQSGYSAPFLNQLTESVKALGITTQEARQSLIRLMQSQIELSYAARLARVAQDLAVISGQNSSEAFGTLIESIAALRPILLRQFGIVKDLTEIYDAYGKSLGKAADDLTQVEKKQAFINVILEEGAKVAGTYEAAMGDVGKQLTSMPRYFEELQNAVGKFLTPALGDAVHILTSIMSDARAALEGPLQLATEAAVKSGQSLQRVKDALPPLVAEFEELANKTDRTADETDRLYTLQLQIANLAPGLIKAFDDTGIAISLTGDELERYTDLLKIHKAVQEGIRAAALALEINETRDAIQKLESEIEALQTRSAKNITFGQQLGLLWRDILGTNDVAIMNGELAEMYKRLNDLQTEFDSLGGEPLDEIGDAGKKAAAQVKQLTKEFGDLNIAISSGVNERLAAIKAQLSDLQFRLDIGQIDTTGYQSALRTMAAELHRQGRYLSDEWLLVAKTMEESWQTSLDQMAAEMQEFVEGGYMGGLSSPARQFNEEMDSTWRDAEDGARGLGQVLLAVSADFGSDLANNVAQAISGFATGGVGGILSGIAGVFNSITSLLTGSNNDLIASHRDLRQSIESWENTIVNLTRQEQAQTTEGLAQILQTAQGLVGQYGTVNPDFVIDVIRQMLESFGVSLPANIGVDQLVPYLERLIEATQDTTSRLEGILTASPDTGLGLIGQLIIWAKQQQLSYEAGTDAIDYWSEVFDLSAEQQLQLYEFLRDFLVGTGMLSQQQEMGLNEIIERLLDEIAAQGEQGNEQTQISRSVARITEKQADSLLSILMTIDLHLRTYLERLISLLQGTGAGVVGGLVGGGSVNFGDVNVAIYTPVANEETGKQVVRGMMQEARAYGRSTVQ